MTIQFNLTKDIIEELDKLAPSPNDKALKVSNFLAQSNKFSIDDINAFCIAHLGSQADSTFSGVRDYIVAINKYYYLAHYYTVNEERSKLTKDGITEPPKSNLVDSDGNPL